MSDRRYEFGDQVRHPSRPEWGIGSIVRAEDVAVKGEPAQRISVRFSNAGLKVLNTSTAALAIVDREEDEVRSAPSVASFDRMQESEWLSGVADRKVEEMMIALPEIARDPFLSVERRLEETLRLYRFECHGSSLVDWAVAQSGLEDPLSRFTRPELEQLFDRWCSERDTLLHRVMGEARGDRVMVKRLVSAAPEAARRIARRFLPA